MKIVANFGASFLPVHLWDFVYVRRVIRKDLAHGMQKCKIRHNNLGVRVMNIGGLGIMCSKSNPVI